jgi:hypothetical protein
VNNTKIELHLLIGDAMEPIQKPSKEEVRVWLLQRQLERTPPPSIQQIRRELGWDLCSKNPPRQQKSVLA